MMPVYMNPKMSLFVSKDLLVTKKCHGNSYITVRLIMMTA